MFSLVRCQTPTSFLSNFFDDWGKDLVHAVDKSIEFYPHIDVIEQKDSFTITADVPGMDKKDISIEVKNGVLTISGEKKDERTEQEKGKYLFTERKFGSFKREFTLPENVNTENMEARYSGGVLKLTIKKIESVNPSKIEIL